MRHFATLSGSTSIPNAKLQLIICESRHVCRRKEQKRERNRKLSNLRCIRDSGKWLIVGVAHAAECIRPLPRKKELACKFSGRASERGRSRSARNSLGIFRLKRQVLSRRIKLAGEFSSIQLVTFASCVFYYKFYSKAKCDRVSSSYI